MDSRPYYAHTLEDRPPCDWEPLPDHLLGVAEGARAFASVFGGGGSGYLCGLWHDLGKYSDAFQDYLLRENGLESVLAHIETPRRVDHSTFGAQLVAGFGVYGRLLAYCLAGHHAGLADTFGDGGLEGRLSKKIGAEGVRENIRQSGSRILEHPFPAPPRLAPAERVCDRPFQAAFLIRMLFSCLVDADFLATEAFMNPTQGQDRVRPIATIPQLCEAMDESIDALALGADPARAVNRHRAAVLAACRARAQDAPGFFTLSVPTGGGKTLSSMAFALRHAEVHGLRRVVVGIPFTSIIEQNASVYRKALGEHADAVLEHHSNFEPDREDRWSRLASENWDAPIVVTTTVQLYESLFANRTGRCRKLHRLAQSVIVLDEVQSIPVRLLQPTLAALDELVRNYGCSIVLCTATQPAVGRREGFPIGLPLGAGCEIVPDIDHLFAGLKRVEIEPVRNIDDERLGEELAGHERVLCIVHTRSASRGLFARLSSLCAEDDGRPLTQRSCLHLSTDMCPEHRSFVLRLVRRRLGRGLACRVVSTSLIEAGVDVDFPVVYRAIAGLDSIAQAAGRCNREGRLGRPGRVVVFRSQQPIPTPMQDLRLAVADAERVMGDHHDILHPEAIHAYFTEHYWKRSNEWDAMKVMDCFKDDKGGEVFKFRSAAQAYRLIDHGQTPVVVPWSRRGRALIEELRRLERPATRAHYRAAQRLSVGIWPRDLAGLEGHAVVEPECEVHGQSIGIGIRVLVNSEGYSPELGIRAANGADPEGLMVGF